MKIGIDISQISYEGTGVARYTSNLIKAICEFDTQNEYIFFFSSLRREIPSETEVLIKKQHKIVNLKLPPTLLDFLWNRLHIISVNRFIGKCDIFISSDWTQPPVDKGVKTITIVHDLVYLRYPKTVHQKILAVQKRRLDLVKKEVNTIITDSQATKKDLIDLLHIKPEKIHVIYPAVEILAKTMTTDYELPTANKYILSVGKQEPRKNIPRLVRAFLKANLKDVDLLIVGPKGWKTESSLTTDYELPTTIKFLGFVPDHKLYSLYKSALFFVYPSLYEGFGYPVIEAMSLGCPVATSNTSSLKEISEESAIMFDPTSEDQIKDAIVKLAGDKKLQKDFAEKGKNKSTEYTLKNFANQLLRTL